MAGNPSTEAFLTDSILIGKRNQKAVPENLRELFKARKMEVTAGIEPAYTALQAAASPLRHVTSERQKSLVNGAVYKWLDGRCNSFSNRPVFAA